MRVDMGTINEQAVQRVVDRLLDGEQGNATFKTLRDTATQLKRGEFGWWGDFVGQKYGGADIYDAYAFLLLQQALHSGELLIAEIELRARPSADKAVDANQRALRAALPKGFSAKVIAGTRDEDGYLRWKHKIKVATIKCRDCEEKGRVWREVSLLPAHAPLEIGSTSAAKTYIQIAMYGALARWPYGQESLYLAVRTVAWGENDEATKHGAFHAIE